MLVFKFGAATPGDSRPGAFSLFRASHRSADTGLVEFVGPDKTCGTRIAWPFKKQSCACFCECNSQQPRTKMGRSAMFRSRHTARRGYARRERFPLLLQFFDPTGLQFSSQQI